MRPDAEADVWTVGALAMAALLALVVLILSGCHDMAPAVTGANTQRDVGHLVAAELRETCTLGYEHAETEEDTRRLNELGCPSAARALRALRTSHAVVVSTLHAIDAGRCTSLVNQGPRECDLTGATLAMVRAAAELAVAMDQIRRGEP